MATTQKGDGCTLERKQYDFGMEESKEIDQEMLVCWVIDGSAEQGVSGAAEDCQKVSLSILSATGFHRPIDFQTKNEQSFTDNTFICYRDALMTVLDHIILLMLLPPRLLSLSISGNSLNTVGKAARNFR